MPDEPNRDLLAPEPPPRPTEKAMADTMRRQLLEVFDNAMADVKAKKTASNVIANFNFPVACVMIVHPQALVVAKMLHDFAVALLSRGGSNKLTTLSKIDPTEDKPPTPGVN